MSRISYNRLRELIEQTPTGEALDILFELTDARQALLLFGESRRRALDAAAHDSRDPTPG
jgi:hypothetical protein